MDGLEFDSSETEVEEYAEELREIERKQKMRDKLREEAKKRLEEKKAKEEAAKRDKKDGLEDFLQGMKDWIKDDDWIEEDDEKIDDSNWFKTKKKYVWNDGDNGYYNTKENLIKKLKLDYLSKAYNNNNFEYKNEKIYEIIKEKYK